MESATHRTEELWKAVLRLETPAEARRFFGDLLTTDEIDDLAKRWRAARLLDAGASYAAIQAETSLSSRTVARISAWLKNGLGGYRLMLNRLSSHSHASHPPHRRSVS